MAEDDLKEDKGDGDDLKQSPLNPASPLKPIAQMWLKKIAAAKKAKSAFDSDAREAMHFFDGGPRWFFENSNRGLTLMSRPTPAPAFRLTVNRVWEVVKLIGAVIYNRNPVRTVTPRKFPVIPPQMVGVDPEAYQIDPMTGQPMPDPAVMQFIDASKAIDAADQTKRIVAELMQTYLNWTPIENNLISHGRQVVDEALIKGGGVLWTEAVSQQNVPPADPTLVIGSFYDSVDNLLLDPDAQVIEEITWCAKRCVLPIDQAARMFGLQRADLKANLESYDSTSRNVDDRHGDGRPGKKRTGKTNDLVTFYKVWSKCGFGDRLKDAKKSDRGVFDPLGDNCYIVVAEGVDYPLNVPPAVMDEELDEEGLPQTLRIRAAWPIPLWADNGGWPFEMFAPHRKPNALWPVSHIRPGIGELRFLNWGMSFLMTRIATSCETIIGVSKAADADIKDQLLAPSENGFKLLEISESLGRSVGDIVSVFAVPGVTRDMWDILAAVAEQFDKRVGLTELVYGSTRNQMRSASEASIKQDNLSIRPDDMAQNFEDFMSRVARKEAMAARWLLRPQDVAPVLGPLGAEAWSMHVTPKDGMDFSSITREYSYTIASGSARKLNKQAEQDRMAMAFQTLGPLLQPLIGAGVVGPLNALVTEWAKVNDLDATPFLIPPPPPPPPMPPPGTGSPPPEGDDGSGAAGAPTTPEEPMNGPPA
jgi:hypothetical protein